MNRQEQAKLMQDIAAELDELSDFHKWDPQEVVKHIAYRVQKFHEAFAAEIFHNCGMRSFDAKQAIATSLMETGWLDTESFASNGMRFMPRPRREEYKTWLEEVRRLEPEPEKVAISTTLQNLAASIQHNGERMFYEETLLCLSAKAYRSAIVMGWNLAYSHLIRWIHSDAGNLHSFNTEITNRWVNKRKQVKYDAIVDEEDFGNIKESAVIEVCRKAKLLTKSNFEIFEEGLRKRNRFAHPNSSEIADAPITAGHLSSLVNVMIKLA